MLLPFVKWHFYKAVAGIIVMSVHKEVLISRTSVIKADMKRRSHWALRYSWSRGSPQQLIVRNVRVR